MADIVLKDKNGNPVTHEGITQIEAVIATGGTQKYSDLQTIRCYYAAYENSKYRVTGSIPSLAALRGRDGVVIMPNGDSRILITPKSLTVGESYTSDYIRGT